MGVVCGSLEAGWYQRHLEDLVANRVKYYEHWKFGWREPWCSTAHHDPGDEDPQR